MVFGDEGQVDAAGRLENGAGIAANGDDMNRHDGGELEEATR